MSIIGRQRVYRNFRDDIIGNEREGVDESDKRIYYLMHHYKMIPKKVQKYIFNLGRSYCSPPIYLCITIGILGTNISRYSTVGRLGCHVDQAERCGAFYNYIAPSRSGKGISMSLLFKLGRHVERNRKATMSTYVEGLIRNSDGSVKSKQLIENQTAIQMPSKVFLPGGNGLQMQTEAGLNGGCGIVNIPEIKTGKAKLTDGVGSYGPMLSFYDDNIPGTTFRKADEIVDMENCRIQLVAAGVIDD